MVELNGAKITDLEDMFLRSAFVVETNKCSANGSVGIYCPPSES